MDSDRFIQFIRPLFKCWLLLFQPRYEILLSAQLITIYPCGLPEAPGLSTSAEDAALAQLLGETGLQ